MSKIWSFLNTPLVVVLLAMFAFPVLTVISGSWAAKLGVRNIAETVSEEVSDAFSQNKLDTRTKKELEAYKKISFSNVRFAPKKWGTNLKVIGTFTNNYSEMVKSFNIGASLYEKGKLANFERVWSSLPKNVSTGESVNFSFDIAIEKDKLKKDYSIGLRAMDLKLYE